MKKKLLAAAVVSAFAAPAAFAQTAPTNVTIYGNLEAQMISIKADGATAGAPANDVPRRNRIGSPGVFNIGFRGTEALGGGLSVIWQVEQNVGSGDGSGTTNSWGSRNTFLGLESGFGQVFFGNFDSPLKLTLGVNNFSFGLTGPSGINPFLNNGDMTGDAPNTNSGTTFAPNTSPDVSFSRRNNNSLNYASPMISGFQFRGQYVANENKTATAGVAQNDPYVWGGSLAWTGGPFRVAAGYEKHVAFRQLASGQNLDDSSYLINGSFNQGPILVTAAYSRLMYGSGSGDITRNNWLVSGQYSLAQHRFRAQYAKANQAEGGTGVTATTFTAANLGTQVSNAVAVTNLGGIRGVGSDTGGDQLSLGYGYALSKRTEGYLFYTRLKNDANARINFAGSHAGIIAANGQDSTVFGVGFLHKF